MRTIERSHLARRMQAICLSLVQNVEMLAAHDAGRARRRSERWRLDKALERFESRLAELRTVRRAILTARRAGDDGRCAFVAEGTNAR